MMHLLQQEQQQHEKSLSQRSGWTTRCHDATVSPMHHPHDSSYDSYRSVSSHLRLRVVFLMTILLLPYQTLTWAFVFDRDTGDHCPERAQRGDCVKDESTFYECAYSCTKQYHRESEEQKLEKTMMGSKFLYDLQIPLARTKKEEEEEKEWNDTNNSTNVTKTIKTKKNWLKFERFRDYVLIVSVVPLLPGMAQYMYDMMDHLRNKFPYYSEVVVFPIARNEEEESSSLGTKIVPKSGSKVFVSETLYHQDNPIFYLNHPVLNHLAKGAVHSRDREIDRGCVTTFVVSVDGKIIERVDQPTLIQLDKYVAYYQKFLDVNGEF